MKLISIKPSTLKTKKLTAVFDVDGKKKTVHFGASGYSDYTIHQDAQRKARYIARHRKNEDWTNPLKPGTLSRYILWQDTDKKTAIRNYKKRFNL